MSCTIPRTQFSPHCKTSASYSAGRRAAILLLFLAHLIFSSGLTFAQDSCAGTSTLIVNTGRDPMTGILYPIGSVDGFWRVTDDRTSGGITLGDLPRCANVIARNRLWDPPMSGSEWIASTPTHANDSSYTITYEREFCIGIVPASPEVYYDLWILVDDIATIYIDGVSIGTASSPTSPLHLFGYAPVPMFTGVHTIKVVTLNTGHVSAGINITGTLTIGVNRVLYPWFLPDGCCTRPCPETECMTEELVLPTNSSWTISEDPDGGITPRCASEIPFPSYLNWGIAIPGSTWIGMNATGNSTTPGTYIFHKYFETSQAATLQLYLSVMADDGVEVYFQGNPILSYPNWAGSNPKILDSTIKVWPGCHVFTFYVNNSGGVATGLDAVIRLLGEGLVKEECSTCPRCPECVTDSYPLSTGYDPTISSKYDVGDVDPYWHVVGDEAGGITPRCANVIDPAYSWPAATGNSQWIGTTPTADNELNGKYIYERCFCMGDLGEVIIDIVVRGDDHAVIMLDGVTIGINNPFGPTNPKSILDTVVLDPGKHCLRIAVYNTANIHSGLNVVGEVRGAGLTHFNCCDDMMQCYEEIINIEQEDLSGVDGTDNGTAGEAMFRSVPNPTSGTTMIHYVVENESMVTLGLYNTAGEQISTLLQERKIAGAYSLPYDVRALPSGIYYLRLTCGGKVLTIPMNVQ